MRIASVVNVVALAALVAVPAIVSVEAAQQKKPSPEVQAYMEYRKEVVKAKRLEDLYYYLDRLTGEYYKSLGPAERTKIFQGLKAQVDMFPNINILKEERNSQTVTLTLEAVSADNSTKATVTVEMMREGPQLKVGPSAWK